MRSDEVSAPGSRSVQHIYNSLFPYYVEVCAVTRYHRKGAKPGGWGGHATLFVNGAELDPAARYPRLRLVADGTGLSDPDSGIGISVNKIFKNVNWVAIPGRDEFFRGGLSPDDTLDLTYYENAVRRAAAAGWFAGISIADELMRQRPAAMSTEEFIVRHSIGTDFALGFARSAYCARLPLSREAIGTVVDHLNCANDAARSSGYTWNAYTNNCSHVLHNALAAAGVWDPKTARGPGLVNLARDVLSVARCLALGRMSDFSFPANSFVRLYEAGNERPIDDVVAAFENHDVVRTMNDGWISTAPGALITTYPMHGPARNEMFAPGRDPLLFSVPVLWDKREKFEQLTHRPPSSVTDLGANLTHFRDRYARTLASRAQDRRRTARADQSGQAFRVFRDAFYDHVASELARTDRLVAAYSELAEIASRSA